MGIPRAIRAARMGRNGDKPFPLLLSIVVVAVLVYLWTANRAYTNGYNDAYVRRSERGRRFAFVSMSTSETSYDHIALSNKFYYAHKHGYDFRFHFEGPRGFWDKFTNIEAAIKTGRYDWIFCLDYDTLITNSSITLDDVVDEALVDVQDPDEIDMILTPDCFPLNTGAMLMRSTPWVLDLLQKAWECGELESEPGQHFTEQDCLLRLIEDNVLHAREKSVIVRQWKMNAFPKEIPCYDDAKTHWEEGMFVIHFAGAWAHVKADDPTGVLMRKYQEYVV